MGEIAQSKNEDIVRISSRDVADMMEISRHSDLISKIDVINEVLENGKIRSQDYWIESTYKTEGNNKTYKEYLISKRGCELLAHKSTGEKGVLFTVKYMDRFEAMEHQLNNPYACLSKELQAIFAIDKKQQEIEVKVDKLYNTMTIDYNQQLEIQSAANIAAIEILGGKKSEAYKKLSKKVYQDLWRSYKKHFRVNSYKNTATKDFENALNYIENFEVDEVLMYAINGLNRQIAFA